MYATEDGEGVTRQEMSINNATINKKSTSSISENDFVSDLDQPRL